MNKNGSEPLPRKSGSLKYEPGHSDRITIGRRKRKKENSKQPRKLCHVPLLSPLVEHWRKDSALVAQVAQALGKGIQTPRNPRPEREMAPGILAI
jgi:hypothetical protein